MVVGREEGTVSMIDSYMQKYKATETDYNKISNSNENKGSFFPSYSYSGVDELEKLGTVISYPKNQLLVKTGQYTDYCYIVKKGNVVAYENCEGGKQRIYGIYEMNSLFLESNLLFDKPVTMAYRTMCKTELLCINKRTLMTAIETEPKFAMVLMKSISDKMFTFMEQIRSENNHDVAWRVGDMIINLAEEYGVQSDEKVIITKKLKQKTMAQILGANRVTVARSIKKLKELNFIDYMDGLLCVYNIDHLKKYTYGCG